MNANNDILSKVLLDSDFTTYWQHLGIVLICLALVFQAYVLLTLLHEFFRRKMILSRKPAIVENQQENSDANVEFDRLWQEIYPLVFDENGIPRPRTEIKLRKIFHYVKQ